MPGTFPWFAVYEQGRFAQIGDPGQPIPAILFSGRGSSGRGKEPPIGPPPRPRSAAPPAAGGRHMSRFCSTLGVMALAVVLPAAAVYGATSPAAKCAIAKNKAAAKKLGAKAK